jgi:thioredoxin-dependent peroxiredoxin
MLTRLQPRTQAPDFEVKDIFNQPISLRDYRGSMVLLSSYRYVTCPLCHFRVNQVLHHYSQYQEKLRFIGIFESKPEYVQSYIHQRRKPPFPMIADPNAELYRLYKVELSLWRTLAAMLRMPTLVRSMTGIDYSMASNRIVGGSITRIPADFLIAADGKIEIVHYGIDASDHLPLHVIDSCLGRKK